MIKTNALSLYCAVALLIFGLYGLDPNPLRWTLWLGFAVAAMGLWAWRGGHLPRGGAAPYTLAVLALAALSLVWSPDWREGALRLTNWIIAGVVFMAFLSMTRHALARVMAVACALALAASLAIEIATDQKIVHWWDNLAGGFGNENFQAEFYVLASILTAGGCIAFERFRFLFLVIAAAGLSGAVAFSGSYTGLAGIAGAGVAVAFYARSRVNDALAIGFCILAAAVVFLSDEMRTALAPRLEYAWLTLRMWGDNPFLGIGLGGFNHSIPAHAGEWQAMTGQTALSELQHFVGSAHNDPLEFAATFGLVGVALVSACLFYVWRHFAQWDDFAWLGAVGVSAALAMGLIGFPLQNPSTLILALAALALMLPRQRWTLVSRRWLAWPAVALVAVTAGYISGATLTGNYYFSLAKKVSQANPPVSFELMNRALQANSWHHQYRMQIGPSLHNLFLRYGPRVRVSREDATRIYQTSINASPTHPLLLTSRAHYLLATGEWRRSDEIKERIAALEKHAGGYPNALLIVYMYYGVSGDSERAAGALQRAVAVGATEQHLKAAAAFVESNKANRID